MLKVSFVPVQRKNDTRWHTDSLTRTGQLMQELARKSLGKDESGFWSFDFLSVGDKGILARFAWKIGEEGADGVITAATILGKLRNLQMFHPRATYSEQLHLMRQLEF